MQSKWNKWIDPTQIYVSEVLNNREPDQNYIADLSESMEAKGFLPEYPIDVFLSENLANIETDLPYVCACGAHRTRAAQNIKLETVFVHIHDGREEAFVEMMHLDNFKFDPAVNTGIGQPFTQKEKRAAVTQLLLLPKFFEQTNTALEEAWRVPQTSIRRWRSEVVELLETNSPKLRHWGVSDDRLARLRELAASSERIDAEGKIVKIRQKYVDASDEEKQEYWDVIEDDVYVLAAEYEEAGKDYIDIKDVERYLRQHLGAENPWYPHEDVTMRQLQQVHQMILDKDDGFIQECLAASRLDEQQKEQKATFEETVDACQRLFIKTYAPQHNKYSSEYRAMRGRFRDFVRSQDPNFEAFEMNYYDYGNDIRDASADVSEAVKAQIEIHQTVMEAITNEAEWLQSFMDVEEKALAKERTAVEAEWHKHRKAAIAAIQAYPRSVGETTLIYHADAYLCQDAGTFEKLLSAEGPSVKRFTATIKAEAENFKEVADAIKNDYPWVQEIPEPKALVDVLPEVVAAKAEKQAEEAPVLTPEAVLRNLSLAEIFAHVKERVIYIPVEDELDLRMELVDTLGKASRGQIGTQLYLLMDHALFIYPEENREGFVIEKDEE